MSLNLPSIRESLKSFAAMQVSRYPQYANHFGNYALVEIKHNVTDRSGRVIFGRGDLAIAKPEIRNVIRHDNVKIVSMIVWSMHLQCDVSVLIHNVNFLDSDIEVVSVSIDDRQFAQ